MDPIIITLGDPAGIGPEVTFKALDSLTQHPPIILFMSEATLNDPYYKTYTKNLIPYAPPLNNSIYYVLCDHHKQIKKIANDPTNAKIAYQCICDAVSFMKDHQYNDLVTAPISKKGCANADIQITGHTTLLQQLFNAPDVSMAFYSDPLKLVLATIHIPIHCVEQTLTNDTLNTTLKNTIKFASTLNIANPHIAIAGLNPHAGEDGQIGTFETTQLIPFINNNQHESYTLSGPISPDIVFNQAVNNQYDIVIALYHDQGLIPLKLLAFDSAVNVTIGLPICRTSPDHGTAYDIAFNNCANPSSMIEAIRYCMRQNQ